MRLCHLRFNKCRGTLRNLCCLYGFCRGSVLRVCTCVAVARRSGCGNMLLFMCSNCWLLSFISDCWPKVPLALLVPADCNVPRPHRCV